MRISLLHPTRGRPEQALQTARLWLSLAAPSHDLDIEYLVALDSQDVESYSTGFLKESFDHSVSIHILHGLRVDPNFQKLPLQEPEKYLSTVNKVNALARYATGDWLFFIADDFVPFSGWNVALAEILKLQDPRTKIVYSSEIKRANLISHPIISRGFYDFQGYFFYPEYIHVGCDVDLWMTATCENAILTLPFEIVSKFVHHNPYLNNNIPLDATYHAGNSALMYQECDRILAERRIYFKEKYNHVFFV